MKMLNENKWIAAGILCFIFLVMLFCNFQTPYIADDYSYHYSWATGERITNVWQIFASMKVHYTATNGRLVTHFLVQIFEMLPKWVFNFCNAALFTAMIGMLYKLSAGQKRSNLLLLCLFGAVWLFTPAFGQVFLWLDGSCNYLWSILMGLFYLLPFAADLLFDKPMKKLWQQFLFLPFSVLMGAYSENVSAAFMGMAVLLQLILMLMQHKKCTWWEPLSVVAALAGYLPMISAEGTAKFNGIEYTAENLRLGFINALKNYQKLEVLLAVFCVFLVLACLERAEKKKLAMALILFAGSLAACFLMMFSANFDDRRLLGSAVLLIAACGVLFQPLFEGRHRAAASALASVLMLYTSLHLLLGVHDVYASGREYRNNVQYIYDCKVQGITEIRLPIIQPETKYSAGHGLYYLSTETADLWPNDAMAKYYGVDSILGY
ncbi:MAG: hypothetical protein IJ404_02735 [Clostridia bacterium]|nr:hypothetical protein [Clostridia bacterium]MBQ8893198.1 hypothetical protein [Clostridia bacterium]